MAPVPARAAPATYYIGNGGDTSGGNCTGSVNSTCTLRDAVAASNANDPGAGQNTITFRSAVTTVTLTAADTTDTTSGLVLRKNVAITVPFGGTVVVQRNMGAAPFRVLAVTANVAANLSNLTISGGTASDYGGGIYNRIGTLTLTNVTVSGNTVSGFSLGYGGGIFNDGGTLTLMNSTVSGNTANYRGRWHRQLCLVSTC